MNYIHHALIGVGTASLGVLAVEALGAPQVAPVALGIGAVVAATGAIATDLDHPKSFISHSIPSRLVRIALAILTIPVLATVATLLTMPDVQGTLNQFAGLVLGIAILRWSLLAFCMSLGLMGLSWLLYRSLHHRGPLHLLIFALAVTIAACVTCAAFKQSWMWGLVFGWGWLWHILADGLTKEGVPFFWPFNDDRKHTLPGWACGIGRGLLSLAAMVGILGLIYLYLRPLFSS
jgi:membrane-bound metal-dependent hydrolase YbcI (DUF457 family)